MKQAVAITLTIYRT